jgi:hypothetical protein
MQPSFATSLQHHRVLRRQPSKKIQVKRNGGSPPASEPPLGMLGGVKNGPSPKTLKLWG